MEVLFSRVYITRVYTPRVSTAPFRTLCLVTLSAIAALLSFGCSNGPFSSQSADVPAVVSVNPNDPFFTHGDDPQWYLETINAPGAWGLYESLWGVSYAAGDLQQVIVSVIDGGIVSGHEDLAPVLSDDGIFLVGGASIPIPRGQDPSMDSNYHGTHVSGLIAARGGNGLGIAGAVYNGWPGPMFLVRPVIALQYEEGYPVDIATAILYSAGLENGTGYVPSRRSGVINMSLGGDISGPDAINPSDVLLMENAVTAAARADVVLVAAAGNGGGQYSGIDVPARLVAVIAVGSIDKNEQRSTFSDYGPELELVAPGATSSTEPWKGILSTYYFPANPSGYTPDLAGTSMAAPLVAAAAAMVRGANPYLSAGQVRQILRGTAQKLPSMGAAGWHEEYGYGLVNMEAALRRALSEPYGRFTSSSTRSLGTIIPEPVTPSRRAEYDSARSEATWDPAEPNRVSVILEAGQDPVTVAALEGVHLTLRTNVPDGILLRLLLDPASAARVFEELKERPGVLLVSQERRAVFTN